MKLNTIDLLEYKQENMIDIKITITECDNAVKILRVYPDISYFEFTELIKTNFEREIRCYLIGSQIIVKFIPLLNYFDKEGDKITVSNDDDLRYFLRADNHLNNSIDYRKICCSIPVVWKKSNGRNMNAHISLRTNLMRRNIFKPGTNLMRRNIFKQGTNHIRRNIFKQETNPILMGPIKSKLANKHQRSNTNHLRRNNPYFNYHPTRPSHWALPNESNRYNNSYIYSMNFNNGFYLLPNPYVNNAAKIEK